MKRVIVIALLLCAGFVNARAQREAVKESTDILSLLPSTAGLVTAVLNRDNKGIIELGLSSVTAIALNYGLNAVVTKETPDGSNAHAFPSTHTLAAFNGATFLMRRYGWKYGVPAYAVATYVAWGRVYAGKHDWWDVLGGAAIGAASALIYTRPHIKNVDLSLAPVTYPAGGCGLYASIKF